MDKLHVIVINDNIVRSNLSELRSRSGAEYWLVGSEHYVDRLSEQHRELYSRILVHDDFDDTGSLVPLLESALAEDQPRELKFLTNDESCELLCLGLQAHFGQPLWSPEQVRPFVNKVASKSVLAGSGVRLPRYVEFDKKRAATEGRGYCAWVADQVGFPLVVKPVDRYASMDVRRIASMAELRAWASWASSPKDRNTYEIDEFIDGTLYNYDALVQHGEIIWDNVCRNINPCMQYAEGRSIGAYTIPADDPAAVAVRAGAARILSAMTPPDGAIHLEIFADQAGELVFLEVAARPPGGDLRAIYLRCFGFDIDMAHFLLRAAEPYQLQTHDFGLYGGWFIHPRRKGTISEIDLPPLRSTHRIALAVAVGDLVERDSQNIVEPPSAEFVLYSNDFAELDSDVEALRDLTLYRVQG